jgi:hypothetical protein
MRRETWEMRRGVDDGSGSETEEESDKGSVGVDATAKGSVRFRRQRGP